MAFVSLNTSEIAAGEPTKQSLFGKIKDNFDDHETRIGDTESFTVNTVPFKFDVVGQGTVQDGVAYLRVPFNITLTGVKLFVWVAGTAGTITIDVERKVGAGAFATVVTSPVAAGFGLGDFAVVAAAGIAISSIPAGAILRLNIDSVQTGVSGFNAIIEYTVDA